jgi:hypothetical protein
MQAKGVKVDLASFVTMIKAAHKEGDLNAALRLAKRYAVVCEAKRLR